MSKLREAAEALAISALIIVGIGAAAVTCGGVIRLVRIVGGF